MLETYRYLAHAEHVGRWIGARTPITGLRYDIIHGALVLFIVTSSVAAQNEGISCGITYGT